MGSVFGTGGHAFVCLARSLQQHGSCIPRGASKADRVHTEAVSAAQGPPRIAAANRVNLTVPLPLLSAVTSGCDRKMKVDFPPRSGGFVKEPRHLRRAIWQR